MASAAYISLSVAIIVASLVSWWMSREAREGWAYKSENIRLKTELEKAEDSIKRMLEVEKIRTQRDREKSLYIAKLSRLLLEAGAGDKLGSASDFVNSMLPSKDGEDPDGGSAIDSGTPS